MLNKYKIKLTDQISFELYQSSKHWFFIVISLKVFQSWRIIRVEIEFKIFDLVSLN